MKPIKFKGQNVVYAENQPEYLPLPALQLKDESGTVITCWELSSDELEEIKLTGKIYLSMFTFNQPLQPVMISTNLEALI